MELKDFLTLVISATAVIVGFITLIMSWRRDRRDRPILETRCELYHETPLALPVLRVIATNVGQRPIALSSFGALHPGKGNWYAFRLEDSGSVVLNQNESYEYEVREWLRILELHGSWAKSLWFEDTTGKRHHVKRSEKYIRMLHKH